MKTAIITGTSSGIGEATAYSLASEGYGVVLEVRSLDKLEGLKSVHLILAGNTRLFSTHASFTNTPGEELCYRKSWGC